MVNLIYLSCRHWRFGIIRSRQVLNLQRPRFFCFSGTLFHKPDCVLIIQSCDSSPVVLERLQKVLLANVKAMAISEFESILTSCLRTHLKTHWGEHLQCNNLFLQFFIDNSIRVEVVELNRLDFYSEGVAF